MNGSEDVGSVSSFPSKLYIKFYVHEEATSTQSISSDLSQISSEVSVSGRVEMQVQALNTSQDVLTLKIGMGDSVFPEKMKWSLSQNVQNDGINKIRIGRTQTERVEIVRFSNGFITKSMPIIVQSQVSRGEAPNECQVAVQIKSNPQNTSSLKDIVISMAIHPSLIAKSLIVNEEEGAFDEIRRLVTWKLKELPVGKTHSVGIKGNLITSYASDDSKTPFFPIVLKCDSNNEMMSSVKIFAECDGPNFSKVTTNTYYSCRILHRAG